MLQGHCIYSRDNVKMRYKLTGVDDSVELRLTVAGTELNSYDNMADPTGVDTSDALWTRRADIQLSKIKVETAQRTDPETGKKVKAPVNTDFWCRFGALIRYAKQQCTSHNEKGYTGLKLASNEFETSDTSEYIITFPNGKGIFANVKLNLGSISYLKLSTSDFEIELEDDPSYIEIFPKIKDGFVSGLMFNTEYLGFEVPMVAPKPIVTNGGMYTCIEDIVADHPDKEFSWLLKKDYHIVDDDHLEEVCQYIQNWDGYVYYDTETTGLNINFKSRTGQADQLVGVVLSVKYGESFFFPCQMKSIPNLCGGDHWYFMEHYMRPILEGKDLVTHNGEFDWRVAYIYDINAHIVHDTMWIIQLTLGASHKNWKVGLKSNAKILLHRDSLELSDLVKDNSWGESDIRFWDLPYELVRLYACADTDNTNGLLQYAIQNDLLNKYNASKVYQIEIGFMFAVAYQEFYGHHIDVNHIDEVRAEIGKEQNELMNEMLKMVGHEFNPNSSIQLRTIMYKELGIPEQRDRVSGKITTSKETLNKLASLTNADDEPMYPFAVALKKYREAEGVRKIIDKFPEHCTSDGYIFSEVNQCGASTGRVSITKPNYQSYNDPIKKNVTPRPGYYMFDTDYSSIEYRVLGNMVGNKNIMERFKDPDFDYHAYQASHMYGVPYSAVTKKLRKAAKGINFGLPYGMGDESLGVRVFGEASPENTRKARDLRAAYFKGQEDIRDWFEYHRDKGVNLGYTETYFGRRRYYHKQDFSEAKIRRQAGNQVIQGTAADLYKIGVGRFFKRICKEGWLGKVLFVGFIHDELLGEISLDIDPAKFLKALREEYEVKVVNEDGTPWSPLYMGFGFGRSWYEAKSTEWSIKLQWEWVAKYGEKGYPKWDGDADKFCDSIPDIIRDYDVRDIRNQLLDPEAQGKEIKPTLNNEIFDCIAYDKAHYKKGIEEYDGDMAGLEKYLDKKYHIQKVLRDNDGVLIDDFDWGKETQPCIDLYCKLHDTDRSKVNILDIPDIDTTEANSSGVNLELLDDEDDDEAQAKRTEAEIQSIVLNQGTFISTGRLYGLSYFINKYKDYILRVGHRVADDTSSNGYALWQVGKLNGELVQAYTGITLDYTDALDLYKMILHDFPLVKVS